MRRVPGMVALGVFALGAAGCGGDGEAAPAAASSTPSAADTAAAVLATPAPGVSSADGSGARLQLGATAVRGPLRLTVDRVERHTMGTATRIGARLHACVARSYDVPAAFTVGAWSGVVDGGALPAVSDSWDPVVTSEPDEPIGGQLVEPGKCVSGFVTFDAHADSTLTSVRYRNRQGDNVVWLITPRVRNSS